MSNKDFEDREFLNKKNIQIPIIISYTIATVALMLATILLKWEVWTVPVMTAFLIITWWLQLTHKLTVIERNTIYFFFYMVEFFFYSSHKGTFFDLAPIAIIALIQFGLTEQVFLTTLTLISYLSSVIYQIFNYILPGTSHHPEYCFQFFLHIGMTIFTYKLCRDFIKRFRRERLIYDNIINELSETNRRTEDFMTNVSHEFRTPINVVMGITSIMLTEEQTVEETQRTLAIRNAGERLYAQIGDILDYTDIDTSRFVLSEEEYSILSIINELTGYLKSNESFSTLEIIFDIDARIPAVLYGDSRRVKTIIFHLLDNAIKFTHEGGVYLRIHTLPKSYGVNLIIDVRDTGIGIPEQECSKIMRGIYQLESTQTRRAGGIGLGLPIVYGFVKNMGGFVKLASEEGKGTSVTVSIPQKVRIAKSNVYLHNPENLCVVWCINGEKFTSPMIREYSANLFRHIQKALQIPIHTAMNTQQYINLKKNYDITHVILGQYEYEEHKDFYEREAKEIRLLLLTSSNFSLPRDSKIFPLEKPFTCASIANFLNADLNETHMADILIPERRKLAFPNTRVLVVDDEDMNRFVARGIFKNYNMQVKTVTNGKDAISICNKEDFDIVFMDYMMPEMDGVEAMKQIRQDLKGHKSQPRMVAFTANAVSGARERFFAEGFDGFVPKPIEPPELERVLKRLLPSKFVYVDSRSNEAGVPYFSPYQHNDNRDEIREPLEKAPSPQPVKDDRESSPKETKPKKSFTEELSNAGFNVQSGLSYCAGDPDFYRELLEQYLRDSSEKLSELEQDYNSKNWKGYHLLAHSVKGISRMVGAGDLAEQAFKLELAAKKQDEEEITKEHPIFLRNYAKVLDTIRNALN
ncbi:MAG: response regulator [Lachnospiraceae bacterium]|nr:response regulator [Lachnospiraceae bacterium]